MIHLNQKLGEEKKTTVQWPISATQKDKSNL